MFKMGNTPFANYLNSLRKNRFQFTNPFYHFFKLTFGKGDGNSLIPTFLIPLQPTLPKPGLGLSVHPHQVASNLRNKVDPILLIDLL
jgi:hypothetical protein